VAEPTYGTCPKCGAMLTADEVDIGVGMQQCGPVHCTQYSYFEPTPEYVQVPRALLSTEPSPS
jgi:hypothetical protein